MHIDLGESSRIVNVFGYVPKEKERRPIPVITTKNNGALYKAY